MAKTSRFKKEYTYRILAIALKDTKRITNTYAAKVFNVTEGAIRSWRTLHPEFNQAFLDAADSFRVMVNDAQIHAINMRKRKIVTDGPDGKTTTIEDVPPNQIASVANAVLKSGLKYSIKPDDGKVELLRNVMKRKIAGELTALEAAQLLEVEGIDVPKTLILEIQKDLGTGGDDTLPPLTIQFVGKERDDDGNS
jgi:hypothetical protein